MRPTSTGIRIAILGIVGTILGVAATATHAQAVSGIDTSQWAVLRNDKMGFEVKYPKNWSVQFPTGTGPENVLMSEPQQPGKEHFVVQFWIQRNVNSRAVPIDQWYADQL